MQSFTEFYEKYPNLAFIKTRIEVTRRELLTDENIILEEDTPPLIHGWSVVIPLCETTFPKVFQEGTAMEVGLYAVDLCEKNGWEINTGTVNYIFKKLEENL